MQLALRILSLGTLATWAGALLGPRDVLQQVDVRHDPHDHLLLLHRHVARVWEKKTFAISRKTNCVRKSPVASSPYFLRKD